jgi:hypothetical protein
MKSSGILTLLCFFGLLFISTVAHAEIIVGATVEWMTDTCPYIGIYRALTVSANSTEQVHIEAELMDAILGKAPKSFTFDYPTWVKQKTPNGPKIGDRFLIFLRDTDEHDIRWQHLISLSTPALSSYDHVALRPDFSLLDDGKEIETVVRNRAKAKPLSAMKWHEYPKIEDRFRVEVPLASPAGLVLFSGSACYLLVPDDLLNMTKKAR